MTHDPSTILQELYEIDPTLRAHETELMPLIQKLLREDPAQTPSPAFVKKLQRELETRSASLSTGAVEYRASSAAPFSFSLFLHRFVYAAAGAVAAVIIAVPVTLQMTRDRSALPALPTEADTADGAVDTFRATPTPSTSTNPRPQSGGGGGGMGLDAKMSGGAAMTLVAPWNPVKYRLEGDLPALPTDDITVLERRLAPLKVPFSSLAESFAVSTIDLSSFPGATVDNVSIVSHVPFGYVINLSMTDGSVSINQQWDQWPHPENDCRDDACYQRLQPKLADIPADQELLKIANAFLKDHTINLEGYGAPIVDTTWRTMYGATEDTRMAYIPDMIRVIYPLLVNGQVVTEVGGEPAGISVQVSIRHKRVSDVWGLTTYAFDRTPYAPVTERAQIEAFLGQAGSQMPDAPTVILRNPTLGYVRLSTYENNASHDLFVPALLFQVTDVPAGVGFTQRTVAVPLAKDMLDQASPPISINPTPLPRPMDATTPDTPLE